jgi:hypothetical protein
LEILLNINLDTVLARVAPRPMTLTMDDTAYKVRRPSIADAAAMDVASQLPSDEFAAHVRGLFDGDAPKCVELINDASLSPEDRLENAMQVTLVREAIARLYLANVSQKKRLVDAITMLEVTEDGTPLSSGSST